MKIREKKWTTKKSYIIILSILFDLFLFVLLQYSIQAEGFFFKILRLLLSYAVRVWGSLAVFFLLKKIASIVNWKKSKAFIFLTKYTMPVYLFHQQVIYFVIIWLNGKVNPLANASANLIIAMSVSLIISCILMRFKYTRYLIGER